MAIGNEIPRSQEEMLAELREFQGRGPHSVTDPVIATPQAGELPSKEAWNGSYSTGSWYCLDCRQRFHDRGVKPMQANSSLDEKDTAICLECGGICKNMKILHERVEAQMVRGRHSTMRKLANYAGIAGCALLFALWPGIPQFLTMTSAALILGPFPNMGTRAKTCGILIATTSSLLLKMSVEIGLLATLGYEHRIYSYVVFGSVLIVLLAMLLIIDKASDLAGRLFFRT